MRGLEPAKIKTDVWKNRVFPLKTGFLEKKICENAQNHQKRPTLYAKFRKISVFQKITPPPTTPSTFFRTA